MYWRSLVSWLIVRSVMIHDWFINLLLAFLTIFFNKRSALTWLDIQIVVLILCTISVNTHKSTPSPSRLNTITLSSLPIHDNIRLLLNSHYREFLFLICLLSKFKRKFFHLNFDILL